MTTKSTFPFLNLIGPIGLLLASLSGCWSAAEHCSGCLALLGADAGVPDLGGDLSPDDEVEVDVPIAPGTGGMIGTGGAPNPGTGGNSGTGGTPNPGTGGISSTGGTPGPATGGRSGTGGMGTGGASTGGRGTGGSGTGGAATGGSGGGLDPDLVLWYKFDEASGTSAADSAALDGTARNGSLVKVGSGNAVFSAMSRVGTNALNLVGSGSTAGGYLTIPSLQGLAPTALTIALWVNLSVNDATQAWDRIFNFGVNTSVFMMLTARNGDTSTVRFAITTKGTGTANEERLTGASPLSAGAWHHLVVVLAAGAPYKGQLYIDNVEVANNPAMTLHASNLGATTNNSLGRSSFTADPFFNGFLDDFRVYRRALTAAEIGSLFALR